MPHPLKVYYPFGGKHIITLWWTHNEQNQIAISPNQNSMESMLHCFLDKYEDCDIKESYEVEIVAPSKSLCDRAEANKLQENIKLFFEMVARQIGEAYKAKYKIPPIFTKCSKWESDYEDNGQTEKDDLSHYSCRNCTERIALSSLTKEEFYHLFYDEWNKLFPRNKYRDEKAIYSRAETAKDDDVLWGAYSNFGHHCRGIALSEVIPDYTNTIQFYYRNPITISVLGYQKIQKEKAQQRALLRKQWDQEHSLRIDFERKQKIEKTLSIFNK